MNSDYIVGLSKTYEARYGVKFEGMSAGPVTDMRERLLQFKTNIDVAMSVLDKNGLGDWLADRLVEIGDRVVDKIPLRVDVTRDPFLDDRLKVANLPVEPQELSVKNAVSGASKTVKVALFRKPGEAAGARRAISEIIKWLNYVTDNRVLTVAADLSESINLEHGSLWGHYDPETNPLGTRLKAAIQEAGNASTAIGLVSQNASVDPDKFAGVWAFSGTYGAFTPLMYLAGARLEPAEPGQQVQDRRSAHPRRAFRSRDRGRRAHALRHLLAAGLEAVPARPHHQPELLGLQRRRARLFRRGRNRRAREEGRHHLDRGREAGPARRRSEHVRGHGSACGREGAVRDSRLRGRPAARLRRCAGRVRDVQSRQGAAEARAGRRQRAK